MFWYGNKQILRMFRDGNVIVAGHKGNGKDLLFQYVISAREKSHEIHSANIKYTEKTKIRPISFYALQFNGSKNFVSGKFSREDKRFTEKEDFYISDVGNALPSQYSSQLDKEYPTFPIVYSLSRHLAQFNIHCNTQNFERVWNKLREQADYYIWCEKATVLFGKIAIQRVVIYNDYKSAVNHIQPYKCYRPLGILPPSKEDRAHANSHNAQYGTIRRYMFWHILPRIHYDTRAYHKLIYGTEAPIIQKKKKKNIKKKGEDNKKL